MSLNQSPSSRMSSYKERRRSSRRQIVNLVSTAASIVLTSTALLSSIHPAAHALVAPSTLPQHPALRRTAPPSPLARSVRASPHQTTPAPRGDRTVRRYVDERLDLDATLALRDVRPSAATPPPASPPRHPLLRLVRAWFALRARAGTIARRDRQRYFAFVERQSREADPATESGLPAGLVAKERTVRGRGATSRALCLARAWCALRAQAKTVAKTDRQSYFHFVENQ